MGKRIVWDEFRDRKMAESATIVVGEKEFTIPPLPLWNDDFLNAVNTGNPKIMVDVMTDGHADWVKEQGMPLVSFIFMVYEGLDIDLGDAGKLLASQARSMNTEQS